MILFTKYLYSVVLDVEAELGKVIADEIVAVAVTSEASVLVASEVSVVTWMYVQKACLETNLYETETIINECSLLHTFLHPK